MALKMIDDTHKYTTVRAADILGPGGARHNYVIETRETVNEETQEVTPARKLLVLDFQNGPIKEAGVNGVMDENLIAIVIDRLRGFQSGPYACDENAGALESLEMSLGYMRERTIRREKQGIEGTHTVDPVQGLEQPKAPLVPGSDADLGKDKEASGEEAGQLFD